MSVDEIITALKNAVSRGESLQSATQTLVNSGYNPLEIQEASKFIGASPANLEVKEEEQLIMPSEKGFFRKFRKKQPIKKSVQTAQTDFVEQTPQKANLYNAFAENQQYALKVRKENALGGLMPAASGVSRFSSEQEDSRPLIRQVNNLNAKKSNYLKEIMLLILLLILVGVLICTIIFKKEIVGLF